MLLQVPTILFGKHIFEWRILEAEYERDVLEKGISRLKGHNTLPKENDDLLQRYPEEFLYFYSFQPIYVDVASKAISNDQLVLEDEVVAHPWQSLASTSKPT